jgi:Zn-finger nucleic acid-binding protein
MLCPRCHVELKWGIAINPHIDANARYIVPQEPLTIKDIELIDVLKCPKCGYSDDGVNPTRLMKVENHNER